jgi:cyclic pyranopterin monophosphate synthase
MNLTHTNKQGQAEMVDISDKDTSVREAHAQAIITMSQEALQLVQQNQIKKGDVLAVARIAGIQAAKKCSDLIPLCHPLALSKVRVDFEIDEDKQLILILAYCKMSGRTGVEMEALTAASIAALTIYDMCKAVDMTMTVTDICLLEKLGGKRGHYLREGTPQLISG